ncbi:MMPL family transporter [Streptomyces olivoverticillatus]
MPSLPPGTGDQTLRSKDGHCALVLVRLTTAARHTAAPHLMSLVSGAHGPLRITPSGAALLVRDLQEQSRKDLSTSEMIALPATLLLLLWVFGGVGAACLPLAVGVVAIAGTLAVLRAVCQFTEVSVFALNWTTAAGLALAVDYSLFLVARYREERTAGATTWRRSSGRWPWLSRTVVISAAIVVLSLTGLLVFPLSFLRSMAYAGIPVVAMAAAAALVLVPAGLSCRGRKAGREGSAGRRAGIARGGRTGTGWSRLAMAVMRHRVLVAVATALVLGTFTLPFRHATFALSDERVLPRRSSAVTAVTELRTVFPGASHTEVDVVLPGWVPTASDSRQRALDVYARRLSALPGAESVRTATGFYSHGKRLDVPCPGQEGRADSRCTALSQRHVSQAGTWLAVFGPDEPFGPAAVRMAQALRATPAPAAPLVAGAPALLLDVRQAITARLPWTIGIIVAATMAVLLLFTGSVFLAVKAVVMNAFSLTATFGAMVWIFQDGHLRHLLGDFTITGTVDTLTAIIVFCLAFGLSMDYEVLLLARVVEAHRRTGETRSAVAAGLQKAAPLFTASAVVVGVVLMSLAVSGITTIKLTGVTIALSLAVDALVVRPLLVPAVMSMADAANWWKPQIPLFRRRLGSPDRSAE